MTGTEWTRASAGLPQIGVNVLSYHNGCHEIAQYRCGSQGDWWSVEGTTIRIAHPEIYWMALPATPIAAEVARITKDRDRLSRIRYEAGNLGLDNQATLGDIKLLEKNANSRLRSLLGCGDEDGPP